jgi:hypothetical protein
MRYEMEEDYLPAREEEDSRPTILFMATHRRPRTSVQRLVKHVEQDSTMSCTYDLPTASEIADWIGPEHGARG